ncbi:hypothetical protein C8J56DRAFT_942650, partial [Mycena floridula]
NLTLPAIICFVDLASCLHDDIILPQDARSDPAAIQLFLSDACKMSLELVNETWDILKSLVWAWKTTLPSTIRSFEDFGYKQGLALRSLYPPSHLCTTAACSRRANGTLLKKAEQHQAILYTLEQGAIPVWSVHLYCDECKINYHHKFSVKDEVATYYDGIPEIVQIGEHRFAERKVVNIWITLMVVSWTSATNCARFYNTTLLGTKEPPEGWQFTFPLSTKHVWEGFMLLTLLEDVNSRGSVLSISHSGERKDRYTAAAEERNQRMREYAQPELLHYCSKCVRFYHGPDGEVNRKVSADVTDGVTLGHPCCASFNCHVPLGNNRHIYCSEHNHLNNICAIVGCSNLILPDHKTCSDPAHQAVEATHRLPRVAHPDDSLAEEADLGALGDLDQPDEEFTVDRTILTSPNPSTSPSLSDPEAVAEPSNPAPNPSIPTPKLRANFGRWRTHNEQLIVKPCGIIVQRGTLFGAEAVGTVAELIKSTYCFPGTMPDHIIYDSNCLMKKLCDPAFDNVGMTVDVFHFKTKHKESDSFCQENCNAADYPELLGGNGKGWFFNSSVAEQTNTWFGGYHAICREMVVHRYNYFLDEMILRRNRLIHAKLEKDGKNPSYWPIPIA